MASRSPKKSGNPDSVSNGVAEPQFLRIRGARTNNLKNIDVDIPRNRFVVLTGVSGSGKSSLAFDTILAEGQRQYIESLSVYARQFFEQMERPEVDRIEGLQPTVAIDQKQRADNPRSTVATITEIYDYLRLLMARTGDVTCHECATSIAQQTTDQIEEELCRLPERTRVMLLAPMIRGRKGAHREVFEQIRKAGFVRVRIDGVTYPLEEVPPLVPQQSHDIEAVVDRLVIREGIADRLAESVRLAIKHGNGVILTALQTPDAKESNPDQWDTRLFNTRYMCPKCGASIAEIEPRTFSFNSPYGACPDCHGLGTKNADSPDAAAKPESQNFASETCPTCQGTRLRREALGCRVGGLAIHEIVGLTVDEAIPFFSELKFGLQLRPIAQPITREIVRRLEFLRKVGAEYLTLARPADTLSGGELQRVRLANGIGAGIVGVLYLFDEPSIGLHPRDNGRLIAAMRDLQREGNSVIVVEHDEAVMRQADYLIDMGPGAGSGGGKIVAQGSPDEVTANDASITGAYLADRKRIEIPKRRRTDPTNSRPSVPAPSSILLTGASLNNLKNIDVDFPLGAFVCVTGVSGSGKSSLVIETLGRELARKLNGASARPGPFASLRGVQHLDRLIEVDQSPIGRTPRSNPATYCGVFDEIRKVFAATKQARQRGYGIGRFSFNVKRGRCEECQGQGLKRIEMKFLPDLFVTCPRCHGARFNQQTLEIRYRGKSIADVLAMSVDEAVRFFENFQPIVRMLSALADVGVGYLSLGQPSTTLSGGEAQRIKLATELGRNQGGHTLYLLDEPTTGLHTDDIRRLLGVLGQLVDQGNTVLVIEHNLDVIKTADWVIDLGPEGGAGGGYLVVAGTPEQVAACEASHTGGYLKPLLG